MNVKRHTAQEKVYQSAAFVSLYDMGQFPRWYWEEQYTLKLKLTKSHETYIRRRPFRNGKQNDRRNAGISKK